jgi:hypothetical protein
MTNAAMQTSAQSTEIDMFDAQASDPCDFDGAIFELRGTMAAPAQVRVKTIGDGSHVRPVLCMEVRPVHAGQGRSLHAEQVYPENGREAAEAKAATLKKGVPITLRTSLKGMRTILPHVQAVERINPPQPEFSP